MLNFIRWKIARKIRIFSRFDLQPKQSKNKPKWYRSRAFIFRTVHPPICHSCITKRTGNVHTKCFNKIMPVMIFSEMIMLILIYFWYSQYCPLLISPVASPGGLFISLGLALTRSIHSIRLRSFCARFPHLDALNQPVAGLVHLFLDQKED